MKRLLIAFWLSLILIFANAQDAELINRLRDSLNFSISNTQKIEILNRLCFTYRHINADSGILYGKQGLQLARQLKLNDKEAKLNYSIGACYSKKGSNTETLQHYFAALKYYEAADDKYMMAQLYFQIGWVYNTQNRNEQTLPFYLKSLAAAEASKNEDNLLDAWFALASYYDNVENYTEALKYDNKVLQADIKNNNNREIASDYINIAGVYSRLKNFDTALQLFPVALKYIQLAKNKDLLGYLYQDWGNAYEGKTNMKKPGDKFDEDSEYSKAISKYKLAEVYFNKSKNDYGVAEANLALGDMMNKIKNYNSAIQYFNKALVISKRTENTDVLPRAYEGLSTADSALGDFKNAFNNYKLRSAIQDTLLTKEKEKAMLELQTKFETTEKEKENQLLKAKNELVTANLDRNRTWLITAGIILLLLGVLLAVVYRNRLIKVRNIVMLKKQSVEISRMNNILEIRALRAQMDPHFIFNCMASLQELIWTNKNEEADDYLSKFSRLLRMVLENSENNTVSLDKELDMLKRYLELESIRLKEKFVYQIKVDDDLFTEAINVPTLIIQPFAENALWHGLMNKEEDRQLKIEVKTMDEMLICTVEDNGIGRQKSKEQKEGLRQHVSRGMKIIEERLRIVREQTHTKETGIEVIDLFNDLHEACGTRVMIRIPIKQSA